MKALSNGRGFNQTQMDGLIVSFWAVVNTQTKTSHGVAIAKKLPRPMFLLAGSCKRKRRRKRLRLRLRLQVSRFQTES